VDTRAILNHQYEAFGAGDADEVVKDFADDAILITAEQVFRGTAAIRAAYRELFAGPFKPGTYDFTLDAEHVEGDVAYITWRLTGATANITLGSDTFVVRNGKIIAQAYTAKVESK
jgi:ketosteroid isomerase-like protein